LSYTTFDYKNIKTDKSKISKNDSLKVSIDITNTGNTAGEEVVQLYIHDEVRSVTPPVEELKGFKKIHLSPGEVKNVKFTITTQMLSFLDEHLNRIIEPGKFDITIGGNSVDVLTASFEITK
jgi:beta-glucosidase